jgi:hypothetical protein
MYKFYLGTLRFLLVILKSFPEFFINMWVFIVEEMPQEFIQARNIILAAYPLNKKLSNPNECDLDVNPFSLLN